MSTKRNLSTLKGSAKIRVRPSVVLGSDGIRGVQQTLFEIITNSIDRWKKGYGKEILITRHIDHSFTIQDFADGLPCDWNDKEKAWNYLLALSTLYGGDNYKQEESLTGTLGHFGLGLTSTNYGSEYMNVVARHTNAKYTMKFKEGRIVDKDTLEFFCDDNDDILDYETGLRGLKIEDNNDGFTGTIINYKPDDSVFTNIFIDVEWIKDKLRKQAVNNNGLKIIFTDEVTSGKHEYQYDTLVDYISELSGGDNISDIISFTAKAEGQDTPKKPKYLMDYNIAFTFNNNINLTEYYHNSSELLELTFNVTTSATKKALTQSIHEYITQHNLYKKGEKIKYDDITDSLICVLITRSTQTSYANQTKLSIDNKFIESFLIQDIKEKFSIYLMENSFEAQKIANQVLINKRANDKADSIRKNIKKKLQNEVKFTDDIPNYVPCKSKDKNITEIYLNEGSSALGGMVLSRNPEFQAGFHVGGKMISLLKATEENIFKSKVINNLYKIFGCGITMSKSKFNKENLPAFNIEKLNWSKIILSTDQDIDAYQIRCLMLVAIYRMSPELIIQGKVYIAEAPLYEIKTKDGEEYFVYTELEKEELLNKLNSKNIKYNTPERNKGLGEMDKFSMAKAIMNPETRRITKVTVADIENMEKAFELWLGDEVSDRKDVIMNNFDYIEKFDAKEEKDIVSILKENYLPYAISMITDRSIISIDGFKPSHRKLLWTLQEKRLYDKKTKSANIVGDNMSYNVHGDGSIYQTLVRMAQTDTLLYPYVNGKGNFGQHTSNSLDPAHMRYTEAGASDINKEFFKGINKGAVKMIPNFDGQKKEPELLPTTFPNILVNYNEGIAVGMATKTPSFPLIDVCNTTIAYIKDKNINISDYLIAPDFATKGCILYDKDELDNIYKTGQGNVTLRGKYIFKDNEITVTEIPYTTTIEKIVSKIKELCKSNDSNYKCINNVLNSTGLNGMSITIEVKKKTDVDKLMTLLFKNTPLESKQSFNMNILCLDNKPRVMGIKELLDEWLIFRRGCLINILSYDINSKSKELHLLKGLKKVLLDIDKAIDIIRNSKGTEMLNQLCEFFDIDLEQAKNITNMKLSNINKDFIINEIKFINNFKKEIDHLQYQLNTPNEIDKIIISDLERVKNEYGQPRKTEIIYEDNLKEISVSELIEDYSCNIVYTKENYLKKTLRYSDTQKVKDGDAVVSMTQVSNKGEIILISDKQNAYKLQINDLDSKQPSAIGMYIPNLIKLDKDENIIGCIATSTYKGFAVITYENGKIHKLPLSSFVTSTKRTLLKNTTTNEKIVSIIQIDEDTDIYLESSQEKGMVINTSYINEKVSRGSQGIIIMSSNSSDFRVIKSELFNNQVDKDTHTVVKKSSGFKLK